jgi:hypothetical protein
MTDRSRRVRRQISDATEAFSGGESDSEAEAGSGEEDYEEEIDPRRSDSMRRAGRHE